MTMYRQGYEVYVEKCEQFGLEPINFRYYVIQLSPQQLTDYNNQAMQKEVKQYAWL